MVEKISACNLGYIDDERYGYTNVDCDIEMPTQCPRCNKATVPQVLDSYALKYSDGDDINLITMFLCRGCENVFLGHYTGKHSRYENHNLMKIKYLSPHADISSQFSNEISTLSSDFVEIFNQAEKAESSGLTRICGIAYRKSLEFLVKDYAIFLNGDMKEGIINTPLAQCIDKYVANEKIKSLSKAAAWIGNDETHYVRKHEDYSVDEMKVFINAMVTYIDSELQVLRAEELLKSK